MNRKDLPLEKIQTQEIYHIYIINQIISSKNMDFYNISRAASLEAEPQIFYFNQVSNQHLPQTKPILEKMKNLDFIDPSESMQYIEQFLTFNVAQNGQQDHDYSVEVLENEKTPITLMSTKNFIQNPPKYKKKGKKVQNSPFHNYQKHLNNALKRLIVFPDFRSSDQDLQVVAREIWNRYLDMDVKTKKILHFIFNERNEHPVSQIELRSFGLFDLYQRYDFQVINKAKNYLSKLAIDQIDDTNLQAYLKTRKIKRMQGLKTYILSFKHQLESGYLKRRINLNQTQF